MWEGEGGVVDSFIVSERENVVDSYPAGVVVLIVLWLMLESLSDKGMQKTCKLRFSGEMNKKRGREGVKGACYIVLRSV